MTAWAMEHPIFAFILIALTIHSVILLLGRVLRTINIIARGWPPEHCDADGEFKSQAYE